MSWTRFVPLLSRGGVVSSSRGKLLFSAVYHLTVFVRRELRFLEDRVSILEDNFCNISLHRDAAGPIGVPGMIIPSEVDSCKLFPFPVTSGHGIVFREENMRSGSAVSLAIILEPCVRMCTEDHVARAIDKSV